MCSSFCSHRSALYTTLHPYPTIPFLSYWLSSSTCVSKLAFDMEISAAFLCFLTVDSNYSIAFPYATKQKKLISRPNELPHGIPTIDRGIT